MTQRVVLLEDEDIDRLLDWYDNFLESDLAEDEDEALMAFLKEHRLK